MIAVPHRRGIKHPRRQGGERGEFVVTGDHKLTAIME
jgi:hypothetical protein